MDEGAETQTLAGTDGDAQQGERNFAPGTVLGERYRIVDLAGRGGMGELYRAEDLTLDCRVALKFLPWMRAHNPAARANFLNEARLARRVSHPNVCRVYDVGELDGHPFISMEYIDGEDLASLLRRIGRLPAERAVEIALQICDGLGAAHGQAILHRDIKPANLMIDADGRARITDFGIAILEDTAIIPLAGGTPAYRAPELPDQPPSVASDLYGLGLVLHEMFFGDKAPKDGRVSATALALLPEGLGQTVASVITSCLAVDPELRPASAEAIAAALSSGGGQERLIRDAMCVVLLSPTDPDGPARICRLAEKHGAREVEAPSRWIFDHPLKAIDFALELQGLTPNATSTPGVQVGIHAAEPALPSWQPGSDPAREKDAWQPAARLAALAEVQQILLTEGAFDLSRNLALHRGSTSGSTTNDLQWLAHGKYEIEGFTETLPVFEVGRTGHSPLRPPKGSPQARRRAVQEMIAGWRPAPGLSLPERPNWRLERQLGAGGFGEVWLTRHVKTREQRVFKFCFEQENLKALQREATLFRLLKEELGDRDDINRILDWQFHQPPYFIESEYTAGGNLIDWTEQRGGIDQVPLGERLEIVAGVAEALSAAHTVGVLHKDVKPANILIENDAEGRPRAKLADFGIGHVLDPRRLAEAEITVLGLTTIFSTALASSSGTSFYMAPEQLAGRPATPQSDLYALGVVLYQLVVADFARLPAPGWERDLDDPILVEDIAATVDGLPERRLASGAELATRLRRHDWRHGRRAWQRLGYRAGRAVALLAPLLALVLVGFHLLRARDNAAEVDGERRDLTRVTVATEWMDRDPTRAALVLLELEQPETAPFALAKIRQALRHQLATVDHAAHDRRLLSIQWSGHGRFFATTAWGSLRIWKADGSGAGEGGRPFELWRGDQSLLATWSGDGSRLLALFQDQRGGARLWTLDPLTGRPVAAAIPLEGHVGRTWGRFSGDGRFILTAGADAAARIWNVDGSGAGEDGQPLTLRHDKEVLEFSLHPEGHLLATSSIDGTVKVWELDSGPLGLRQVGQPRVLRHDGIVFRTYWSPDGQHLASASQDSLVRIWPLLPNGRDLGEPQVLRAHQSSVRVVQWSPVSRHLLTHSRDQTVRVWDFDDLSRSIVVARDVDVGLTGRLWSPDGRHILTRSGEGSAHLWRAEELLRGDAVAPVLLRGHQATLTSAAWSPDGRRLVTGSADGRIRLWQLDERTDPILLNSGSSVYGARFSPDGRHVATVANDGFLRVWPIIDGIAHGSPRIYPSHATTAHSLAWSQDSRLIVTTSADDTALIQDLEGETHKRLQGHGDSVNQAKFSPDGKYVATASVDSTLRVWSVDEDRPPIILRGHLTDLTDVAWSPDGLRLASASADLTGRIWAPFEQPPSSIVLEGHEKTLRSISWSPDGQHLLTASDDRTARLWHNDGRATEIVFKGHQSAVYVARFSPDGQRLVTASFDGMVMLHNADGSGEPEVLSGHRLAVMDAAWSPDGRHVVTASLDHTARIWRAEVSDPLAELRASTRACLDPLFRVDNLGESPAEAEARFAACER